MKYKVIYSKYTSPRILLEWVEDDKKRTKMIGSFYLPKKEGDAFAEKIVKFLNDDDKD